MSSKHSSHKRPLPSSEHVSISKIPKLDLESFDGTICNEIEDSHFYEDIKCSICSEILIKSVTLNCSHTFCKDCIDKWTATGADCPVCRGKIIYKVPTLALDNIIDKILETLPKRAQSHRQRLILERTKKGISPKASKNKNGWIKMRRMNGLSSYYMIPTYINARRNLNEVTIMYFQQDHDPEWEDLEDFDSDQCEEIAENMLT